MFEEKPKNAKRQVLAQLESIHEMVMRVRHAKGCRGKKCLQYVHQSYDCADSRYELCERAEVHELETALHVISEDPLEITVEGSKSGGTEIYTVLLCTGGPAVRIVGDLTSSQPKTAQIEYCDTLLSWRKLETTAADEKRSWPMLVSLIPA